MQSRYKIRIYDTTGTMTAELDKFSGLVIVHRVNSTGYCNIMLDGNDPKVPYFTGRDYVVNIFRSVPDMGIDWYLEYEGFFRTSVRQFYVNGAKTFSAYCSGFNDLLRRRIVAYYSGTDSSGSNYTEKTGPADSVMKEFVNENAGLLATSPPRIEDGVTAGLSIEADLGLGTVWDGAKAYRNLLDVCQEISTDVGDTFFDVVGLTPNTWEFQTFLNVRGKDRRAIGIDPATGLNSAGETPVIFSAELGNVSDAVLSIATTEEINKVYGLGVGEESARMVAVVEDAASIALTPINLHEASRNATSEKTLACVTDFATKYLNESKATVDFNFTAMQIKGCIYGRDYWWGDYVTGRYDAYEADKFIIGSTIVVNTENNPVEIVTLELADV
jgi:hypothetical protein